MKTPVLFLLLSVILVHTSSCFPASERGKHASWDDVNVVAHGLLQLGQGLKEHVDKTRVQMREVAVRMRELNGTLQELSRTQRRQDEERREQTETAEGALLKAEEVRKETQEVSGRMGRLEEALTAQTDGNHSSGSPFIQKLLAAQNRRIDHLVEKIKQQQDKLEKQSVHLQALTDKVAHKRVKSHRRRDGETTLKEQKTQTGLARDCHDVFVRGQRVSGVYSVQPENSQPFRVYCHMTADEGWTVVQRRQDGSQDFNQSWENYRRGFGSLDGDFWLGLDFLRSLSAQTRLVLQVELLDSAGQRRDVRYRFRLDGAERDFSVHLETESDRLVLDGVPFSTPDRDNDQNAAVNCAQRLTGGWWFSDCGDSNLNGRFPVRRRSRRTDMFWRTEGRSFPLRMTMMKIAPEHKL